MGLWTGVGSPQRRLESHRLLEGGQMLSNPVGRCDSPGARSSGSREGVLCLSPVGDVTQDGRMRNGR